MANLAVILKKMGKNVTGCDIKEEFITDKLLQDNKINWTIGFDFDKLPEKTDLVVYSAAHGGTNNPLIIEAKEKNIKIMANNKLFPNIKRVFFINSRRLNQELVSNGLAWWFRKCSINWPAHFLAW